MFMKTLTKGSFTFLETRYEELKTIIFPVFLVMTKDILVSEDILRISLVATQN